MGMPDIAYSAAVIRSRRLKISSRGELLMARTYFAKVESDRMAMPVVLVPSMLVRSAGDGIDAEGGGERRRLRASGDIVLFLTCLCPWR